MFVDICTLRIYKTPNLGSRTAVSVRGKVEQAPFEYCGDTSPLIFTLFSSDVSIVSFPSIEMSICLRLRERDSARAETLPGAED